MVTIWIANGRPRPLFHYIAHPETNELDKSEPDRNTNAALIAAAQAVEHYEITRYGTLVAWSKQLGRTDCASLLQKNRDEEKVTDSKLNNLAEGHLNKRAA